MVQLPAFAQNQFCLGNAAMLINEGLVLHLWTLSIVVSISE